MMADKQQQGPGSFAQHCTWQQRLHMRGHSCKVQIDELTYGRADAGPFLAIILPLSSPISSPDAVISPWYCATLCTRRRCRQGNSTLMDFLWVKLGDPSPKGRGSGTARWGYSLGPPTEAFVPAMACCWFNKTVQCSLQMTH